MLYKILTNPNNLSIRFDFNNGVSQKYRSTDAIVANGNFTGNTSWGISNLTSGSDYTGVTANVNVIDLTQMFGSTIADYIYSLETATAGAGVAWFKKLFPKDYYAYNAGQLISVKTSAHNTVGFNQWDEQWESGYYNDADGLPASNATRIRTKNRIKVFPSTTYYVKVPDRVQLFYYDKDDNFISTTNWLNSTTFTTPANAYYLRFYLVGTTTYGNNVCINLSWSGYRNGEYEPYEKHEYALDSDIELRGIPKLDSANNLYYDGDEYEDDGTVDRKYGIVDLGTLDWYTSTNNFYAELAGVKRPSTWVTVPNILCSMYMPSGADPIALGTADKVIGITPTADRVTIRDTAYADAVAFKTAMSGVYLVYELATPTTEEADPYQQIQICDDFGTEEFVDTRTVPIPVGHETRYPANLRDKLQHLPDLADADGYYMIQQSNNDMSLVLFRIPQAPSEDGEYTLKATVSGGTPTYTWESTESEGE